MKTILYLIILLILAVAISAHGAITPQLQELVKIKALEYKVPAPLLEKIIACESNGSTTIQSNHYHKGKREDSWGVSQINLYWNPSVTKAQALDPEFSVNFLAKKISQGKGKMWSCFPKPIRQIKR